LALAQAHQVDVGAGIINPEVLRAGRVNYLIKSDTLYLGLEAAVDDFGTEPDEEEVPEEPENAISDAESFVKVYVALVARRGATDAGWTEEAREAALEARRQNKKSDWEKKNGKVVAYHGTTSDVIEKIKKEGLSISPDSRSWQDESLYRGDRGESVYVTSSLAAAKEWGGMAASNKIATEPMVVELHVPADEWKKFKQDRSAGTMGLEAAEEAKSKRTTQTIPPSWIAKIHKGLDIHSEEDGFADSSPAPLCVTRPVLNTAELKAWARSQGFRSIVADPHVTVLYSKQPVDWMKMGRGRTDVVIPEGEPRVVEPICPGGPVVLHVSCPELSWRHDQLVREGASHDYPEYQPHVTITYEYEGVDLEKVTPFRGEIKLGPEKFSRVDETKPFEVNETMLKSGVRR
jgi:hypothetical protein